MITLTGISKRYSRDSAALDDVHLHIPAGEFVSIVGQSGSGKTTLVKLLIAEERPTAGSIQIDGWDITRIPYRDIPYLRRQVGVIFQDFKLLPDRSVKDNMLFVLRATGWHEKDAMEHKIDEVLDKVGMKEYAHKMPHQISGGEQQRVGIARALAVEPEVLLLDEPFSALDAKTTAELHDDIINIWRETKKTIIMLETMVL